MKGTVFFFLPPSTERGLFLRFVCVCFEKMRKSTLSLGKRGEKKEEAKNSPGLPRKLKKEDGGIEKQFEELLVGR